MNNVKIFFTLLPGYQNDQQYTNFNIDRKQQSLAGRRLLKTALTSFSHSYNTGVQIKHDKFGKPFIPGCKLSFNISHSKNIVMCAICTFEAIGIDVEVVDREIYHLKNKILSKSERKLCTTSDDVFKFWTLKESYLKAIGTGLSKSPNQITIKDIENFTFFTDKIENRYRYAVSYKSQEGTGAHCTPELYFVEYQNL
jgi:phosphopantetheinyl transferase